MNLLYPKIRLNHLRGILGHAAVGALFAAVYGIVHDQITYSISPEYFTRLKFIQFHYADFGFPPRVFVAEVGVLATWWVGLIAGWFVARKTVPYFAPKIALRKSLMGFGITFMVALLAGAVGYLLGWGEHQTQTTLPGSTLHRAMALRVCQALCGSLIFTTQVDRGRALRTRRMEKFSHG